jgi:hypothetical protein
MGGEDVRGVFGGRDGGDGRCCHVFYADDVQSRSIVGFTTALLSHPLFPSLSSQVLVPISSSPLYLLPNPPMGSKQASNPHQPPRITRYKTYVNSHVAQLRPTHRMIEIILAKVVLGQIRNVRKLDVRNVRGS